MTFSYNLFIYQKKKLQYNFVGRLLGPRGNSLKRMEATTECRVLIRGRGSIKDPARVMILNCLWLHILEFFHMLIYDRFLSSVKDVVTIAVLLGR